MLGLVLSMTLPAWLRRSWVVRGGLAALAVLAAVGAPRAAHAQTCPSLNITPNGVVNRYVGTADNAANSWPLREQNLNPTYINYADCAANARLNFTILVGGLPCTDTIQVWAGTVDCTQTAARLANSGMTRCWQVVPQGHFQMAASSTADIRAQDIVAYISNPSPPLGYIAQGETACHSQTAPGGVALTIYFMAVEADGQTVDAFGTYAMGADLVGPYPPSNVTAGIGQNVIIVNWTPAVDSTIQGYNIYCQDLGATNAEGGLILPEASLVCPDAGAKIPDSSLDGISPLEASVPTDAGGCFYVNVLDGGGSGGATCVSSVLKNEFTTSPTAVSTEAGIEAGFVPTPLEGGEGGAPNTTVGISNIPPQYLCGQVGGNTTSSFAVTNFVEGGMGILDGHEYAVTVAATDGTANTGIIGNLSCVTPSPVIDFWTAYTNAGGLAGGGFCALEGPGMPVGGSLFGIGMFAAAATLARRRARRRP